MVDFKSFADSMIDMAWEGADCGDDIQELALKHGLLKTVRAEHPCGDCCICAEVALDDFPVQCYRKTY